MVNHYCNMLDPKNTQKQVTENKFVFSTSFFIYGERIYKNQFRMLKLEKNPKTNTKFIFIQDITYSKLKQMVCKTRVTCNFFLPSSLKILLLTCFVVNM